MIRHSKNLLYILLLLACSTFARAQVKNFGIPLIHNFPKSQYKAGTQSWAIAQDYRGMMYFANNEGVLEFDGKFWKCFPLPNFSVVRSIMVSSDKILYAGAFNEFGYFSYDKNGRCTFHSLVNKLPVNERKFGEIWRIHETSDGIYFQSFSHIFLLQGGKLSTIVAGSNMQFSYKVGKNIITQVKGEGLYYVNKQSLTFIKGSELFSDKEIWTMALTTSNTLLLGTLNDGVYIYDGLNFKAWTGATNEFLKKNQIFTGIALGNNYFAFGTIQNGVLITDVQGNTMQHLDRNKGLQNNTVLSIFNDKSNNIWIGLDNGIDFIESNSAISFLTAGKEIGAGYISLKQGNFIYLGTNQGLFRMPWHDTGKPETKVDIEKVDNTQGQIWSLFAINNQLLCGHDKGTYLVDNLSARKICNIEGVWKIFKITPESPFLIQGTYSGLSVLEQSGGTWQFRNKIKGFNESSRMIEVEDDSTIWISHGNIGVFKVKVNKNLDSVSSVKLYTTANGLPTNYRINVLRLEEKVIFTTEHGIYFYNKSTDTFEPFDDMNKLFGNSVVSMINNGNPNYFWYIRDNEPGILLRHIDGSFSIEKTPLRKLNGIFIRSFENILQVDDKNVIMSTENGFVHFNPLYNSNIKHELNCFIREVSFINDSVIFSGGKPTDNYVHFTYEKNIPYASNALRFVFVANSFDEANKITYKYILDGFDAEWFDWTSGSVKEYTNIPEGGYTFKVKARDIFGNESNIRSWHFYVSPPWYRSVFAYIVYILIFTFLSFLLLRRLVRKFEAEKRELESRQLRELEDRDLKHAREVLLSQQEIVKLRNEMLELENERNKVEVDQKNKELASQASQMTRKNEVLDKIKVQLNKFESSIKPEDRKKLNLLIKAIDQDIRMDEDWVKFEKYFDQVHGDFIKHLRDKYSQLTPTDLKLCAYLKMNISSKEIAPLLNISVRSVEVSRYRLRKKLNLAPTDNLIDFMLSM